MKIKQTILAFAILTGFIAVLSGPTTYAASCGNVELTAGQNCCGGVVTTIISCGQSGACASGPMDPWEGSDPGTDAKKLKAYKEKYTYTDPTTHAKKTHLYGKCFDGSSPTNGTEKSGVWGILLLVINILTAGVGIVAVGGVVYGSILYTAAGGSPDQVKQAKTIIGNTIVGLLAYAFLFSFLNYIIPGGLF